MKSILRLLQLAALVLAPIGALAAPNTWTEDMIYVATKEACELTTWSQVSGNSFESNHLRIGHFRSQKFNELLNYVQLSSAEKAAKTLNLFARNQSVFAFTQSSGLQRALQECYPNDPRMIRFFDTSILRAEERGRIGIIAVVLTGGVAVSKTLAALGTFGKYVSHALNFTQVAGLVTQVYQVRKQAAAEKSKVQSVCGDAKDHELNDCKVDAFFSDLDKTEAAFTQRKQDAEALRDLLIETAKSDISKLSLDRKNATSADAIRQIDVLIAQRQKFLESASR